MKVEWDELKDEIIGDFCDERCHEEFEDRECLDHDCPVWRTLGFAIDEEIKDSHPGRS